jgi:hypothetical protein
MARNFKKPTTSMRGRVIDMDALRAQNEDSRAIGNGRMNARGDIIGPNGQIEVRREQIARDYHNRNPMAAMPVSLKPAVPDRFETPEQAVSRLTGKVEEPKAETDAPQGVLPKKGRRLVNDSKD